MKHLKKFDSLKEGKTPHTGMSEKHSGRELFEELEDRLVIDGVFDSWKCIKKELSKHPVHSDIEIYVFWFDTGIDLWPDHTHRNKYYNNSIVDNELNEMKKMINWKIIQHLGVRTNEFCWKAQEDGTWEGGVYNRWVKEKAVIILEFMRPPWWTDEKISYKEVSDKESGII